MATTGQTISDRLNAGWYALAGQGLARVVCKATTEEVLGPKKKHLSYLVACTDEPNVSIPQMANLIIERTHNTSWVVVFKALITVHHLMIFGNERFTQYLASSNYSFELSGFLDRTAGLGYNMSTYVRRYSKYINQKVLSYRLLAVDLCKINQGKEGYLGKMHFEELMKTLPNLQSQFDCLLEFDCNTNDLNNGVIDSCFHLLFRDLNKLYGAYHDGMIILLERYFKLSRRNCREALAFYKKFLVSMDKAADFLKVAEAIGIEKTNTHDMKPYTSLLGPLENHLQNLEAKSGKKGAAATTKDGPALSSETKTETASEDTNTTTAAAPKSSSPSPSCSKEEAKKPASPAPEAPTTEVPKPKKTPPAKPEPPRPPRPASPKKNKIPTNDAAESAKTSNPFAATAPTDRETTSDCKLNEKECKKDIEKKGTFADTFGGENEEGKQSASADNPSDETQKPKASQPTTSPLVSPTRNMKLDVKKDTDAESGPAKDDGNDDEVVSQRPSRPPSRPPPPSSANTGGTVSPTKAETKGVSPEPATKEESDQPVKSQVDETQVEEVTEEPDDKHQDVNEKVQDQSDDNVCEEGTEAG